MRKSVRSTGALGLVVAAVVAAAGASIAYAAVDRVDEAAAVGFPAERVAPDPQPTSPELRVAAPVVELVNAERSRRGLPALEWHDAVGAAARAHATDMAAHRRMRHTGSDGSNAGDRLEREGFVWSSWGENIAAGIYAAEVLVDAWMNSPTHRSHLLGGSSYVGVGGVADADGIPYWTLVVANRSDPSN